MKDFYKRFNPVVFKYGLSESDIEDYNILEDFENIYQFSDLTKTYYGETIKNIDLVYADKNRSDDIIELFSLISDKIIGRYLNIEGLEHLFSEKYIDFEWDMHMGIDYKKHKMKYYRDHFIHQIRNAYCIHKILDDNKGGGILHYIKKVLKEPDKSKVSSYVYKCIQQQKVKGYFPGYDKNVFDFTKYNTDDFYYRNVIFMASYMAALFHDIGYPEVHNTLNQNRITEYIANIYNAETSGFDFTRLKALLQNSLLFRVVSFIEIRSRMEDEKPDHGVFSAIIFLLNFYENGVIESLEPYKRCALELAALAIYNHTNKYSYSFDTTENQYVRISFMLNPISYLLRICDDMQEWDRVYFELSKASNLIVCNNCRLPIIRNRIEHERGNPYRYICGCMFEDNKKTPFDPVFEYDSNFRYRRIYNVIVCDKLVIYKGENYLKFYLNYSLAELLHIAYISPSYAIQRVKELNDLKKFFDYQFDLPALYIDYFVTANPILIKTQILKTWCNAVGFNFDDDPNFKAIINKNSIDDIRKEYFFKRADIVNVIIGMLSNKISVYKGGIYDKITEAVSLYANLALIMEVCIHINSDKMSSIFFLEEYNKNKGKMGLDIKLSSDELNELIRDSIEQSTKLYKDIENMKIRPSNYYEQFSSGNYTYGCIERYVPSRQYELFLMKEGNVLDAFTDLGLFKDLLKEIK